MDRFEIAKGDVLKNEVNHEENSWRIHCRNKDNVWPGGPCSSCGTYDDYDNFVMKEEKWPPLFKFLMYSYWYIS